MSDPDHTTTWDRPTVAHRYLFHDGHTMDIITTQTRSRASSPSPNQETTT